MSSRGRSLSMFAVQRAFNRVRRGYDPDEVDRHLELVSHTEHERITQTVLDYFEGWYDGDVARMDRALHPDLVKRWPGAEHGASLPITTQAADARAHHQGRRAKDAAERRIDITMEDVGEDIASVTVRTVVYHEYLQLVQTHGGRKIANAL